MIHLCRALPIALLVALFPLPALAQERGADEIRDLLERYEETAASVRAIEDRLDPVRRQALERSSDLQARVATLQRSLESRFNALDPEFDARMDRAEALHDEAIEAQERGDHGRMQALEHEAEDLRRHFEELQDRVLTDPEVERELNAYQEALVRGMRELDPEAEALLAELERLNERMEELRVELNTLLSDGASARGDR